MIVGRSDVLDARARIAGRVRTTPVIDIEIDGQPLTLKLELLQHTGSFKPRGAFNRVLSEPTLPAAGLIAASGGNHGAAVAYVGRVLGVPVEVFVPEVTPAIKRQRIEGLGATVVVGGAHYPGEPFDFWTKDPGVSYVNDPLFGQAVDGRRLVDGRASFGVGLQAFLLGMPMHFDWSWLTDLQVRSASARFQFWIGYDF